MNVVDSYRHSINETLQAFALQLEQFVQVAFKTVTEIRREFSLATTAWRTPIEFTPLQWTLFKVLTLLLLFTSILIGYSWKVYGKVITDKFVRPSEYATSLSSKYRCK